MTPSQSKAEYQRRINQVLDYIEEHLHEPLALRKLARVACFSEFHFHKLFRALMGETLNDFITRVRVEKALFLMRHSPHLSFTEIALECGFQTPANFSRVFRKRLGTSPRQFDLAEYWQNRKIGKETRSVSLYYQKEFRADSNEFAVRVEPRGELNVAYIRVFDSFTAGKVAQAFDRLAHWATAGGLLTPEARFIGMSKDDPEITPLDKYSYDVCLTVPRGVRGEGEIGVRRLAPALYAVLPVRGDFPKVDRAWNYLFKSWLPRSGYQPTQRPAMEVFLRSPIEIGWEQFDLEGWVPVKPL